MHAPLHQPRIAIVDLKTRSYVSDPDIEIAAARNIARIELLHLESERDLLTLGGTFDVLINWHTIPLSKSTIETFHGCKGIVRAAVGYDNIDLQAARACGIPVANVPDYGTEEVADHTMAMLLSIARGLEAGHAEVQSCGWSWQYSAPRLRLRGRTIGIIGLGRIGMAVAKRAAAFGLTVAFFDPYISSGVEKSLGIERHESLESVLQVSSILTLHVPLTDETRGFIGEPALNLLPHGAIILNTSRGDVIKLDALRRGIESGTIAAAGLDVLESEPSIPGWITTDSRVLTTPHTAFYSEESFVELRERSIQIAIQFLKGKTPREIINYG